MEKVMKKETVLLAVIVVVVGFLAGVIYSNSQKSNTNSTSSQAASSAPLKNYQQEIQMLTELVKREPENRNAWVRLGHNYFDSDQMMKAIEAYDQALKLDGNDANVLTDQGVMYRRVGWYDKAIANFKKAAQINPGHLQSLFNLGIVYRYDTNELDKARKVWTKYLEIAPEGEQKAQVRAQLAQLP
jgi:tetratricopeptide (TPR) repeat protein